MEAARPARRLTRAEQVERNRGRLLAAAREAFLERGYAGASLETISERAGFSKGVVYSRFASKADLFLALLERRIEERARHNEDAVRGHAPAEAFARLLERVAEDQLSAQRWGLVVIEFRAHAARDPELNARYARLHEVTLTRLAGLLARLYQELGTEPPAEPRVLAEFVVGAGNGLFLELALRPGSPTDALTNLVRRALGVAER